MEPSDIEREIFAYIKKALGHKAAGLDRTTALISGGLLDSFGIVDFVEFLEARFTIRLAAGEMTPEALDSVAQVGELVEGKRNQRGNDAP